MRGALFRSSAPARPGSQLDSRSFECHGHRRSIDTQFFAHLDQGSSSGVQIHGLFQAISRQEAVAAGHPFPLKDDRHRAAVDLELPSQLIHREASGVALKEGGNFGTSEAPSGAARGSTSNHFPP